MLRFRWMFGLILLACLAVSLACVGYPMYVIRPFRAQGARELAAALVVSRYRGMATVISALGALAALAAYWPVQPRKWRRILAAVGAGLVCVLAVLARINVFELMFHPIDHASFAAAAKSKLDGGEKVIAIVVNGQARAYPIRGMAYHHIINDEVGKTAIVATY
jgi:hypothetical protein